MYKFIVSCSFLFLIACAFSYDSDPLTTDRLKTIPLELTTHLGDKQQFIRGDEIQFLLSLGNDAYIYMYYIDADDRITQILPNKNQRSNFYSTGDFLNIPEYENGYHFVISEPFGKEEVWVFASDQMIDIDTDSSIETIKQKIKQQSRRGYGEYVLNIVTAP